LAWFFSSTRTCGFTGIGVNVKRSIAIATAASSILLLAGCGQTNEAAKVGNEVITTTQVQNSITEILRERSKVDTSGMTLATGTDLAKAQTQFFIISDLFNQVAINNGWSLSDVEVGKAMDKAVSQIGGAAVLPKVLVNSQIAPSNLRQYFRTFLISTRLGQALAATGVAQTAISQAVQQRIAAEAAAVGVTINPRYGKWDANNAVITAADLANGVVAKL
jgi:hypothetical protein